MSRILFAWELGENFGHLARDLAVALALRSAGHEVLFAVCNTRVAEELLAPAGFAFVPIPMHIAVTRRATSPANYSEILAACGYLDQLALSGMVRAWLSLIDLWRPSVLIVDHAPTSLIAARIKKLPTLLLGTGFAVPPPVTPLPSIRPWESVDKERLIVADRAVLQTINGVIALHGASALSGVADLFSNHPTLLTTFAELDHYGPRTRAEYVGPIQIAFPARAAHWPEGEGPKIFAYLRPTVPGVEALLAALVESDARVICTMPGVTVAMKNRFETKRLHLLPHTVRVEPLLSSADLGVSYGGAGSIANTLLQGVPMLLVPQAIEQYLGSVCVEKLGAGILVRTARSKQDFSQALTTALSNSTYRAAAQNFSHRYRGFQMTAAVSRAVEIIESAL